MNEIIETHELVRSTTKCVCVCVSEVKCNMGEMEKKEGRTSIGKRQLLTQHFYPDSSFGGWHKVCIRSLTRVRAVRLLTSNRIYFEPIDSNMSAH